MLEDRDLSDPGSITAKQFGTDFRVPDVFYLELVMLVRRKEWFPAGEQDACDRQSHPVERKVSTADGPPSRSRVGVCSCRIRCSASSDCVRCCKNRMSDLTVDLFLCTKMGVDVRTVCGNSTLKSTCTPVCAVLQQCNTQQYNHC